MTTKSFWLEEPVELLPRKGMAGTPDVAVVGGGVTGCSCALTLAERGVRVRLYEAKEIAAGASGRNGGFALRGGSRPYDTMRSQLGAERARALWELSERALERLSGLAGDAFRRTGSLRLAADDEERSALRGEVEALERDGFAVECVDVLDGLLAGLFRGAIFHPYDGALQPARWVRRLARQAAEAGADIVEQEPVQPHEVEADAVVVAADGLTSQLVPELVDAVRPTRGQVLVTAPLDRLLFDRPHYARYGYDYWRQLPDRRLVIGGSRDVSLEDEETDLDETTDVVQTSIEQLVERLIGQVPTVTHRWAGIWGTTPDGLPLVGRLPGSERVWIAGGYSGHGNVLGLACGELVARAILGETPPELELFEPARFELEL
jgi:glycine/D-amino acid oxidase-like deaminating enzyme